MKQTQKLMLFSVDIVIHVNGTVNNKLIVQANSYGTAFSDVDVTIDRKTKDIVKKKLKLLQRIMKV